MKTPTFTSAAVLATGLLLSPVAHADNCKLTVVYRPQGDGPSPLSRMYPLFPNTYPFAFTAPSIAECTQESKNVLMKAPGAVITMSESVWISSVRFQFTDADGFRYVGKVKAPKE